MASVVYGPEAIVLVLALAGVAALTSAFPELLPYPIWLCLGVLALITAINVRGSR